ncbi:MAG: hypothetical protein ACYC5A_07240 [Thermoleophilia bacterium]
MKWLIARFKKIGAWIGRLPVALKVLLGVSLFFILFGGTYGSYRIYNYTQHDPEFCRSCHTMNLAWDKWAESEHSKVGCHSCHQASPIASARLVVVYLLDRPDTNTSHAHISDESCEKCHYSGDPQWVQVEETAGHKFHAEEQNIACQTCHGMRLHEFRPATEICVACHADHVSGNEKAIKTADMQDLHCVECHEFLGEDSAIRPTNETCLECHRKLDNHGVTFPGEDAPMHWDCRECHKPHDSDRPVVDCIGCHTEARTAGLHASPTHAESKCKSCHKPHEWVVTARENCAECHSDKVESHNPGKLCTECHDFGEISMGPAGEPLQNGQETPVDA